MASPILKGLPLLRRRRPLSFISRRLIASAAPSNQEPAVADAIFIKDPTSSSSPFATRDETSATAPMSFATGSIIGKRFYSEVTTRPADDGNGWTVMLDYRTLKTPSKRPLKLPTLALAKAIAAEWEYQQTDGIRPFTMPLMKLACTALERVPLTRAKIIDHLMKKFHQDLVFCRSPGDNDLTRGVRKKQEEKIDPILDWVQYEFGFKPEVHYSFFGGKQGGDLVKAVEVCLKKTTDCELAAIDAMAAAAHSLVIPLAIFRGRIGIEDAIELIRLEEDLQVDKWGLVEGGHDIDIADLQVQISSAAVFLGLSCRQLIFVWLMLAALVSSLIGFVGSGLYMVPVLRGCWLPLGFHLDWLLLWMAIFVPYPSHSLFLLRRHPHAQGQPFPRPSIRSPCSSSRTATHLTSPTTTPTVTEEDDSLPPPPPATAGCRTCGREEIERGCNGEGRIQGGIATVPGFGWWPIKAYRPCPGFTASGGRYRRRGQSMDDVASGRGRGREMPLKSTEDEAKSSSKKKMKQQSS